MGVDIERFVDRFDHHDPEFSQDGVPWEIYAALRERSPVAHTDAWGGFYVLSHHSDVARVARDPATFSNRWSVTIPGLPPEQPAPERSVNIPLGMDPPEFNEWRRMLNPYFSPQKAEARIPEMRAIVTQLIDSWVEAGSAELYDGLLSPFPAIVTCRILGLPEGDWHFFADPVHESLQSRKAQSERTYGGGPSPAMGAAVMKMVEIAQERRHAGGDDVLSFLGQTEVHGRPLEEFEMAGICSVLLGGGVDTTTNAIGVSLVEISRRPEVRRRLLEDPSLIPSAVEEFLRMWSPFQGLARRVMSDVEVGGCPMHEGDRVLMLWPSANRDPAEFDRPDEVVIDRSPNRHLAFGLGPHRCIGAHLARAEMRVALEEVLRRLPDFSIDEDGLALQEDCGLMYGYGRVPVTFTPGRREGLSSAWPAFPRDLVVARDAIAEWLRPRLGDVAVSAISLPETNGGSNETFLLDAGPERLVVRVRPIANGRQLFFEDDFDLQERVLRWLHAHTAVPVPVILWSEDDPAVLGAPFWVMRRAEGRVPGDWPPYNQAGFVAEATPEARRRLWENAVDALAMLHSASAGADLAFLDKPDRGATGLDQQLWWWGHFLEWSLDGRDEPSIPRKLREWVYGNVPPDRPTALSWGDARVGNMVFDDALECRALLDWEMVSLGGPLEDLGWWLFLDRWSSEGFDCPRLEGLGSRRETIDRWEGRTGQAAAHVEWYERFAAFRMAAIMIRSSARRAAAGEAVDPSWAGDNPVTRIAERML